MLTVTSVSKGFSGRTVLDSVSLQFKDSEMVGIVGPSGSGKSVLLKILGGVLGPDSGRIEHPKRGEEVNSVGFLFQEGGLFDSMTVVENVAFPLLQGAGSGNLVRHEALERAAKVLGRVGLGKALLKVPGQLSGGMRRRVGIARALVGEPDLVLLDDPTGGLDPVAASVIMDLVRELHRETMPTVIIVSHDIRRLLPNTERIIALFHGRVVSDVPREALLTQGAPEVIKFLSMRYDFSGTADRCAQGSGEAQ